MASQKLMGSNEAVIVENAVSKLYYLQFITRNQYILGRAFSTNTVLFEAIEIFHPIMKTLLEIKTKVYVC